MLAHVSVLVWLVDLLWELVAASLGVWPLGGAKCEAISVMRAVTDLPLALMKISTSRGFLTVVNETKSTLLRASCARVS